MAASGGSTQGSAGSPGSIAFQLAQGCTRAAADGKDFLVAGCVGSISRIDPSSGKPLWTVMDPTWTEARKLALSGEVVVATMRVSVPASGLTAKADGDRVVAVADGRKLWETPLSATYDSHFNATADLVVTDYSGERSSGMVKPGKLTAYEARTGRVRFERQVDGNKCAGEGPMILKSAVIACGQRLSLTDGSGLPLLATTSVLGANAAADTAVGYENDVTFKILRSDGSLANTATGEFMAFAGDVIVSQKPEDNGRAGKALGINLNGTPRWEQAVSFGMPRWFFDNVSYANGSVWVRNTSDELVAIDGASGRSSSPLAVKTAGLGKQVRVLAATPSVLAVSTGEPEMAHTLRFVHR